ncbi:Hypothetical predicted protein [Paramuricea clavata]|uniref:Uncharacterized protein n=1 Tax=Paramuricea clavata TaxID=317549 RepID=A0A6S7HKU0_PARCT|nr:Hypothetical predicted protein [Paramuricea clavata]
MDDDGWQLLPKPAKRLKKLTCFDKCIFCQTGNANLRVAEPSSLEKVVSALKQRQDEVSQRLTPNDLCHVEGKRVLCHSSCYEAFTSKQNLKFSESKTSNNPVDVKVGKRCGTLFDWSRCMFCRNATRKKDRNLINIVTFEACSTIKESVEARVGHQLLDVLQSVNYDLIAAGGKYHKACHASHVSKVNIKRMQHDTSTIDENPFDEAFNQLVKTITTEINKGKAYDMNILLAMFKKELEKLCNAEESYTKQKLKARLVAHYKEDIMFHQPPQQSKPEIVYSSSISLVDIINAAINSPPPDTTSCISKEKMNASTSEFFDIYAVATQVRQEVMKCKGIDINPLDISDLNLDIAKELLPQNLYWLLRWIITGQQYSDRTSSSSARIPADERKIIMVAQDIVHCASHARAKLPKHGARAMSVKHITGSKQLVTLLNRMGHCSSYMEIEQVETGLANESLARSKTSVVIIPTNKNPGVWTTTILMKRRSTGRRQHMQRQWLYTSASSTDPSQHALCTPIIPKRRGRWIQLVIWLS